MAARTGPRTGTNGRVPEAEPARRIRPAEAEARLEPPKRLQRADVARARDRPLDEVVPAQGLDELALPAGPLHVGQQPGAGRRLGEEGEDVLEGHGLLAQLLARMAEDERPVGPPEDVQLHEVDPEGESRLHRGDRVRRRERGRAPVPDPQHRPVAAEEVHGAVGSGFSSKLTAPRGELEDHPVGDPLDRRSIVRPRIGCGLDDAHLPREEVGERPQPRRCARASRPTSTRCGAARSSPITNWLKRSACQERTSGNSVASVPETGPRSGGRPAPWRR